jgi:hypothetical protein
MFKILGGKSAASTSTPEPAKPTPSE